MPALIHHTPKISNRCSARPTGFGSQRHGAAAVFGLILILSLVVLMAFTMDYGNIHIAQSELRRSADSAAMAACWEMFDHQASNSAENFSEDAAREAANAAAYLNTVGRDPLQFNADDVEFGTYSASSAGRFRHLGNVQIQCRPRHVAATKR